MEDKLSKNRPRKRSLKVNAIVNTLNTLLSLAFPLITFPYVSRILGVNQLGKYNFANSINSYFLLIAGLGISSYAVREGTQYRDNQGKIDEFASEMFSINIVSSLLSYAILFVCLLLIRRFDSCRTEILIFSIEIIATTFGVQWIYNIYEDFVFIAIRSFVFQCLSLILLFCFVKGPGDLDKYVFITVLSLTGNNVFNWFYAKKYCHIKFIKKIDWNHHLKPILVIFSTSIAITIYVSSDTTMLGFLVNDDNYSVGIYSVSTKIYNIFKNLIVSFLVVLIPRFSLMVHEKNGKENVSALFNYLSTILITVASPMIFGLIMLSNDVVLIVSGPDYLKAVPSLIILMVACFFSFFAYLFSQCILIPNKREKDFFVATAISASVNIVLNFILIPLLQEIGAAITTLLAEIITMLFVRKASKSYIDVNINKNDINSVIIGTLAVIIICFIANNYIYNMWARVLLSIVISIFVYWLILKKMNNSVIDRLEKELSKRVHLRSK
jgi:O-antigen/teichoic acid export membrane protein